MPGCVNAAYHSNAHHGMHGPHEYPYVGRQLLAHSLLGTCNTVQYHIVQAKKARAWHITVPYFKDNPITLFAVLYLTAYNTVYYLICNWQAAGLDNTNANASSQRSINSLDTNSPSHTEHHTRYISGTIHGKHCSLHNWCS